jgi:hypothetical protein
MAYELQRMYVKEQKEPLKSVRFEMNKDLHKLIKERALFRSITVKQWVQEAVIAKIQEENRYR